MNDTRIAEENPVLMTEILSLVGKCESIYKQKRVFNRVLALVMAELFAFGRHTLTQLLLTLGLTEEDWSAWYRLFSMQRYVEEATSAVMLGEMLCEAPEEAPFVVGVDAFPVPRESQTMPGTGWARGLRTAKFRPGIQRVQRFVEVSWLPTMDDGYSRAIPLRTLPAFTAKSVPCEEEPRTEVKAGLEILEWTRKQMDKKERSEQLLMALGDGNYDTLDFWQGLPERTIALARTARNRALYHLPPKDGHGNRKYGEKAPAPCEWLRKRKGFCYQDIMIRGRQRTMRYRLEGPYLRDEQPDIPLFLIVIGGGRRPKGSRRKQYKPCFFLVSAVLVDGEWVLPLPIEELLAWLWQRWELEVAHRQMKSGLGLGEKQCWNQYATIATVQWSLWIYSLMMLAGYRVWRNQCGPVPLGLWRVIPRRWSFNTLLRTIRAEMWQHPVFRTTWIWSRDNWAVNESLWDNLFNSILASARV
jgi:hypothetical protein